MLVLMAVFACSTEAPTTAETPAKNGRHVAAPIAKKQDAPAVAEETEEAPHKSGNRAPLVETIEMAPGSPTRLDTLVATVKASDPDGQTVTLEYDWLVNGKEVPRARKPQLALGDFVRGDKVVLRVTATDYEDTTVIDGDEVVIANAAPVIATDPKKIKSLDGFAVQANDPDGDPLTWTAEGGPPSMTVDKGGVLHWKGSIDDKGGHFTVRVTAADAFEGKATLELPIDIAPGKPGKLPAPPPKI